MDIYIIKDLRLRLSSFRASRHIGQQLDAERTIHRSVFSLFPCDVGSHQVFLEYSAPCLLWTFSSPALSVVHDIATFESPSLGRRNM